MKAKSKLLVKTGTNVNFHKSNANPF